MNEQVAVGDTVIAREVASVPKAEGRAGKVTEVNNHSIRVKFFADIPNSEGQLPGVFNPNGWIVKRWEKISEKDADVFEAIEVVKEKHGLCEEADNAIDRAWDMNFQERLKRIAKDHGNEWLYLELEDVLASKNDPVKVGQWISGLNGAGEKVTFQVTKVIRNRNPTHSRMFGNYWAVLGMVRGNDVKFAIYEDGSPKVDRRTHLSTGDRAENWFKEYAVSDTKPAEVGEWYTGSAPITGLYRRGMTADKNARQYEAGQAFWDLTSKYQLLWIDEE